MAGLEHDRTAWNPMESARRAAHSLKGAARGVGLGAGLLLGHALEACFIAAQRGHMVLQPADFGPIRRGLAIYDRIARTPPGEFNRWIAGSERDELKTMLAELDALRRGTDRPAAPRPAIVTPIPLPSEPVSAPVLGDADNATLLDLFHDEARNLSRALVAGLEALERAPGDSSALDECRLAAHSLKGASRIVGLTMAVSVARALENCFSQAQRAGTGLSSQTIGLLLRGAELLGEITGAPVAEAGQWGSAKRAEVEVFLGALEQELAAAPPASPASVEPPPERFLRDAPPLAEDLGAALAGIAVVPGASVAARAAAASLREAARASGLTMAAALAKALEDSLAVTPDDELGGEAVAVLRHAAALLSAIARSGDLADGQWGSHRRADVELSIAALGRLRPGEPG